MYGRPQRRLLQEIKSGPSLARVECKLVQLKLDGSTEEDMTFTGYGAVFDNVDSGGDMIVKGAFRNTIKAAKASGQWPAMLQQHGGWQMSADDMMPIGVWTEMSEDDTGLLLTGKLAPTTRGREMYTLMKMQPRPAITGLSIGYRPVKWKTSIKPDEPRRTLTEVELLEVSPVTFPMNPKARVTSAKGLTIRMAEEALRDAGFSASEAKAIVARGFKAQTLTARDAGELGEIAALIQSNTQSLRNQ